MKKLFWLNIALVVLTFIGIAVAYPYMPEKIPTHWNIDGVIDAYGSRAILFIMPSIMALVTVLIYFLPKIDPKSKKAKGSENTNMWIMFAINLFTAAVTGFMIAAAFGYDVAMDKAICVLVGGLFIALGIYLPKVKPNYFIGIRTPWTLESETVWVKTHHRGRRVFIISGLLFVSSIVLPPPINFMVPFAALMGGVAGVVVYSFIVYKKEEKNNV